MATITVISPGPLTTIQDLGRPGFAHVGVPRSGAADRPALILANRLLGNDDGAPALETTLLGPTFEVDAETVIALTGAPVDALPLATPVTLRAGERVRIGAARQGLRTYIAFGGGLEVPRVLGSAATDLLTGLGPVPLVKGTRLHTAPARHEQPPSVAVGATSEPGSTELRVLLGPREDWFTDTAIQCLTHDPFAVTPHSNRIGLRLGGVPLQRARSGELLSEGLVPGALQVPADGHPILLLADHPTTGGYPVIAVVHSDDLPLAAQLRPGQQLRFVLA